MQNLLKLYFSLSCCLTTVASSQAFEPASYKSQDKSSILVPYALADINKGYFVDFSVVISSDEAFERGFLIISEYKKHPLFYIIFFEAKISIYGRLLDNPDYKISKKDFIFQKKEIPTELAQNTLEKWREEILKTKYVNRDNAQRIDGGGFYHIGIAYARFKFARVTAKSSGIKQSATLTQILNIYKNKRLKKASE